MVTVGADVLSVPDAAARRRSIRRYRPDPVPRTDLEAIVRLAGLAPSAFNLQPWRFVVVDQADIRDALAAAAYHQPQASSAPAIIVLYTDTEDALASFEEIVHPDLDALARDRSRASAQRFFTKLSPQAREMWGSEQGYIALGYLLLAAAAHGYQTSPMLGFDADRVRAALHLPAHVRVPALVAIGHGDEDGRPHHRLPLDRILRFA